MSPAQTIDHATTDGAAGETDLPVLTSLAEVAALQEGTDGLYLRISAGPEEDRRSGGWDDESGYLLPGLPAWLLRPEKWWAGGARLWLARQLVRHGSHLAGGRTNKSWLLTGDVVGHGADGEPLIARWKPVALLARGVMPEAESAYAAWRYRSLR